jgi:DNA-directed RNA polymerase specialized sigma24 family protein
MSDVSRGSDKPEPGSRRREVGLLRRIGERRSGWQGDLSNLPGLCRDARYRRCRSLLNDGDDAQDALQETFLLSKRYEARKTAVARRSDFSASRAVQFKTC